MFNLYKYSRKFLKIPYMVSGECEFLLSWMNFSRVFPKLGERDNVSLLHLEAEITLAKFFIARSFQKFCLTLSKCMTTSLVLTSCMLCPLEGLTLPTVSCSVSGMSIACHVSTVLVVSK